MSNSVGNRTTELLAVTWFWTAASTIAISVRFWCRSKYQRRIWWDDFWALLTLIFSLSMSLIWTVYAHAGGALHVVALTPSEIVYVVKLNWISQPLCILGLVCGKLSVACLILRLQSPTKWRTILLWTLCSILSVWACIQIVMVFVQCDPVTLLWDPTSDPNGHCWSPTVVTNNAIAICSYMAFLDLFLAALPVHMIMGLQMQLKKKIAICCLLSTGVVAFIAAVVKITELSNDSVRNDLTWATVDLFIWNANEVNIVLIAACVPTLVPMFEIVTGRRSAASYRKGGQYYSSDSHDSSSRVRGRNSPQATTGSMNTDRTSEPEQLYQNVKSYHHNISSGARSTIHRCDTNGDLNIEVTKQFSVVNSTPI